MELSGKDALRRLVEAARAIDPALIVDRGSVRVIDGPFPGVEFGLAVGDAHSLIFMPAADIAGEGWEGRLRSRLADAHRYLLGFPRPARTP